jgi:hypothetical protein
VAATDAAAAGSALVTGVELGDVDADLVAVPATAVDVIAPIAGVVDPSALAAATTVPETGAPLGAGAEALRVDVEVVDASPTASVQLAAWLFDGRGTPTRVRLDPATPEVPLPDGSGPWRLVAVTAQLGVSPGAPRAGVRLDGAAGIGGDEIAAEGRVDLERAGEPQILWGAAPAGALPVAMSAPLAEALGVVPGDTTEFRFAGSGRREQVEVAAVVPVVPGAGGTRAVYADLEALTAVSLGRSGSAVLPTSIWLDAALDRAPELAEAFGGAEILEAGPGAAARSASALIPAWIVTAAGGLVLAVIAVAAIVATMHRARRGEVGVLRALGMPARTLASARAAELAGVLGGATIAGALVGSLSLLLVVGPLVSAAAPGVSRVVETGVVVDIAVAASLLGATVLALAGVAAIAALLAGRDARTATVDEEAR